MRSGLNKLEANMYARLIELQIAPGKMDECIKIFRDRNAPAIATQPGFDHGQWFVDRETGRAMSVTFWQDEAVERASRAKIPMLIERMAHVLADQQVRQATFEVVHEQRGWEEPWHG